MQWSFWCAPKEFRNGKLLGFLGLDFFFLFDQSPSPLSWAEAHRGDEFPVPEDRAGWDIEKKTLPVRSGQRGEGWAAALRTLRHFFCQQNKWCAVQGFPSSGEVAEGKSPHLSLGSIPLPLVGLLSVFQEKHLFKTPNLGMENKYQPVQHKPPIRSYQQNTEK